MMCSIAGALAQQRANEQASHFYWIMNLRAHYARKGMTLINVVKETDTGTTWVIVQRPTTIPKVTR